MNQRSPKELRPELGDPERKKRQWKFTKIRMQKEPPSRWLTKYNFYTYPFYIFFIFFSWGVGSRKGVLRDVDCHKGSVSRGVSLVLSFSTLFPSCFLPLLKIVTYVLFVMKRSSYEINDWFFLNDVFLWISCIHTTRHSYCKSRLGVKYWVMTNLVSEHQDIGPVDT